MFLFCATGKEKKQKVLRFSYFLRTFAKACKYIWWFFKGVLRFGDIFNNFLRSASKLTGSFTWFFTSCTFWALNLCGKAFGSAWSIFFNFQKLILTFLFSVCTFSLASTIEKSANYSIPLIGCFPLSFLNTKNNLINFKFN